MHSRADVGEVGKMNNDADQKPKFFGEEEFETYADTLIESLRAENYELKKEKEEYYEKYRRSYDVETKALETKLSAANAQMEKMAEALDYYKKLKQEYLSLGGLFNPELMNLSDVALQSIFNPASEGLAQHEEFKKDSK